MWSIYSTAPAHWAKYIYWYTNTESTEGKTTSFTFVGIFHTCIINLQEVLTRIHTCPNQYKVHTLFHEQAVHKRGTKNGKNLEFSNLDMCSLHINDEVRQCITRVQDSLSTIQWTEINLRKKKPVITIERMWTKKKNMDSGIVTWTHPTDTKETIIFLFPYKVFHIEIIIWRNSIHQFAALYLKLHKWEGSSDTRLQPFTSHWPKKLLV